MRRLRSFISVLLVAFSFFNPIRCYQVVRLGARGIAAFRATYGREPPQEEIALIASHVQNEVMYQPLRRG